MVLGNTALGRPEAQIRIDTSNAERAESTMGRVGRGIRSAMLPAAQGVNQFANELEVARRNADRFGGGTLTTISNGARSLAAGLAPFSAAAAGITAFGARAALNSKSIEASYRVILGSASRAEQELRSMRELSDRFQLPFLETAEGARGFLTVVNETGIGLERMVSLAARLRLNNPAQSVGDAAFALRELLSGDTVSIIDRFNLSRKEINRIKSEAAGDQAETIRLLGEYLDQLGLTEDALVEMGQSGVNAFSRLRSATSEALGVAFMPALENVFLPMAEGVVRMLDALRQTNPELLTFAGTGTIIAAGLAPALLAINKLIEAYRMLRTLAATSTLPPVGRGVSRVALGGVAAAAGVGIGIAGANVLANAGVESGDLGRIREGEDASAILSERLGQILGIVIAALGEFVVGLNNLGMIFENSVNSVFNAIQLFVMHIIDGGLAMVEGIGLLIKGMGEQLGLDALTESGTRISGDANAARFGRTTFVKPEITPEMRETLSELPIEVANAIIAEYETVMVRSRGVQDDINDLRSELSGFGDDLLTDEQRQRLADIRAQMSIDVTGILESMGLIPKAVEETVEEIEDESNRTKSVLTQFGEALREASQSDAFKEMIEKIASFQEEMEKLAGDRMRDVLEEAEDFARRRMHAMEDEARENAKRQRDQLQREQELIDSLREIDSEGAREQADLLEREHRERERRMQQHQDNINDIINGGHRDLVDAIAAGNGIAAINAVRDTRERITKEKKEYEEAESQREEDLELEIKAIEERREERRADAVKQLQEMREQFAQAQRERDYDFQLRLRREDETRSINLQREEAAWQRRLQTMQNAHNAEIQALQQRINVEHNLNQLFLQSTSSVLDGIRNKAIQVFGDIFNAIPTSTQQTSGVSGIGSAGGRGAQPTPFHIGGLVTRSGLANVRAGEAFIQPPPAGRADLPRGFGGGMSIHIASIENHFTDTTDLDEERIAERVAEMTADKVANAVEAERMLRTQVVPL